MPIHTRRKCHWRYVGDDVQDHRCRSCAVVYDEEFIAFRCLECGGVRPLCNSKAVKATDPATAANIYREAAIKAASASIEDLFVKFETQTINRVFNIHDLSLSPSVLVDALRSFVIVHADDADRQIVKDLVVAGYELQLSDYMPVGFGYVQSADRCGHIAFEKGTAMVWENAALKFETALPENWHTSSADRLAERIARGSQRLPPFPWTYRDPNAL